MTYGVVAPILSRLVSTCQHRVTRQEGALHLRWDMTGPQGEVVGIHGSQLVVQRRNVMDQPQILDRVVARNRGWVDVYGLERENASALPLDNGCLDLGCPHEVGLVGSRRAVGISGRNIVVGAANLVLGAVAAVTCQNRALVGGDEWTTHH